MKQETRIKWIRAKMKAKNKKKVKEKVENKSSYSITLEGKMKMILKTWKMVKVKMKEKMKHQIIS